MRGSDSAKYIEFCRSTYVVPDDLHTGNAVAAIRKSDTITSPVPPVKDILKDFIASTVRQDSNSFYNNASKNVLILGYRKIVGLQNLQTGLNIAVIFMLL